LAHRNGRCLGQLVVGLDPAGRSLFVIQDDPAVGSDMKCRRFFSTAAGEYGERRAMLQLEEADASARAGSSSVYVVGRHRRL
jgi:hypothetical protein